ncbi:sigma factor [Spirillospora sp. CA-142024]|uniref:sigma factor n=1 Tax=Spirillospora sp. CA-142024 TaxID=3240036 RepID=UPI003D8E8D32
MGGTRSGRGSQARRRGVQGLRSEDRGAAVPVNDADVRETITRTHHEEWCWVVASLTRRFGDLDIAEEAAVEAFSAAVERWPADGVPPNPGGWLTTTAGRKAIDRIRRENKRDDKHQGALRPVSSLGDGHLNVRPCPAPIGDFVRIDHLIPGMRHQRQPPMRWRGPARRRPPREARSPGSRRPASGGRRPGRAAAGSASL